jgi:AraC family transcriptional regulator
MNLSGIDPVRWRTAEQGFQLSPAEGLAHSVRRSSFKLPWRGLWVWEQAGPVEDLYVAPSGAHCLIFRRGSPTRLLQRQGNEIHQRLWSTGEVLVVPAGTPSFWRSELPRENVHVDLLPEWLERAAGGRGPVVLRNSFGAHDPMLASLLQALVASLDDNTSLHAPFGDAMAMAVATHLVEHYAAGRGTTEKTCVLSARQMRQLSDFVRERLSAPCDVARLAQQVDLSPAHFSRCFKASSGLTPHQFVIRLKLEHARELLLTTDLAVADVAHAIGYASRAHFAQAFRQHWGASPAQLRRLH